MDMTTQRPFRFGLSARTAASASEWVAKARRAEDLGFSTLLVADHFGPSLATIPALQAAAHATTKIRLGSFVFDNDYRHPALLQKEVATLDLLTDGRVELGIGSGGDRPEYEQVGIAFDPPDVRVARLQEALAVIKGLFRSTPAEPFSFSGTFYQIRGLIGGPAPVQRPHPPIVIGGGGRRVLELAAHEANVVGVTFWRHPDGTPNAASLSAEATAKQIAWVREAAGERLEQLELNMLIQRVAVTTDERERQAAVEALAEEWDVEPKVVHESPHVLFGSVSELVAQLRARRDQYGFSYISVFEPVMETFAPIVQQLTGQ
jgi:probable F420-dependent oxidoreductase